MLSSFDFDQIDQIIPQEKNDNIPFFNTCSGPTSYLSSQNYDNPFYKAPNSCNPTMSFISTRIAQSGLRQLAAQRQALQVSQMAIRNLSQSSVIRNKDYEKHRVQVSMMPMVESR